MSDLRDRLRRAARPTYWRLRAARDRFVAPVPWKLRWLTARRGRRPVVVFAPDLPDVHHVLYRVAHRRGWRIRHAGDTDVACRMLWSPRSLLGEAEARSGWLNGECLDIRKQTVDRVAAEVFGYDIRIEPRSWVGECVQKSDANAQHDGQVVMAPIAEPDPAMVYQRVIRNVDADGMAEDLRVVVIGGALPVAYRKLRPVARRFSNVNHRVELVGTEHLITTVEQDLVLEVCARLRVDYAEIDLLRDRDDGRLYLIDINRTPYGPPNHLGRRDAGRALDRIGEAFAAAFGPGVL